jgi:hypothetical protein
MPSGRVGAAPTRPEGTTTFVLTHPPRFSYRFPHQSAPSGRAQRASAHASGKAISYQFAYTPDRGKTWQPMLKGWKSIDQMFFLDREHGWACGVSPGFGKNSLVALYAP